MTGRAVKTTSSALLVLATTLGNQSKTGYAKRTQNGPLRSHDLIPQQV